MANTKQLKQQEFSSRLKRYRSLYLLIIPALIYVIIFYYVPIYGVQIAFKDYRISKGILDSEWVGLAHFQRFVTYLDFGRLITNTLRLSLYSILTFPCGLIFALSINEMRNLRYKKLVQMVMYMPHFISVVVLVSMLSLFFAKSNGLFNNILELLGGSRYELLTNPDAFPHLYVWSGVWQDLGWNSIIYVAALAGVPLELVEAAELDGAGRLRVIWHVNIPIILPTVVTMFILSTGSILSVGFEKVYLMQNAPNLSVSQVISTYVYQIGLVNGQFSYSTAIGLFNNLVNVIVLMIVNGVANRLSGVSLF